jgi:hypothetical protein
MTNVAELNPSEELQSVGGATVGSATTGKTLPNWVARTFLGFLCLVTVVWVGLLGWGAAHATHLILAMLH